MSFVFQLLREDEGMPPAVVFEDSTSPGFVPLWEESYVLAVPEDHPLAVQETVGLADLHRVAFVERTHCELHAAWQAAMGRGEVVPEVRAQADNEAWALGPGSA